MKFFARLSLTLMLLLGGTVALPAASYAFSPFGDVCTQTKDAQNVNSSAVCKDGSTTADPLTGTNGLIFKIVNIISFVAGAAAIIIIIISGLKFITSGGSSDEVASARRSILYAAIGLVVIVLARTLVAFILGKI